jgi:hypothetical protein
MCSLDNAILNSSHLQHAMWGVMHVMIFKAGFLVSRHQLFQQECH